ncbi:hypothetical protein ABZ669_15805 [Streptomyces hirsutus]|uniref:hypothetical protein n=1 Tax=Streptomyces hirsutus TaxID=35620 RepID=UPI0033BFB83C
MANAHPRTTGPYALRVRAAEAGRLRVGVWDTGPWVPRGLTDAMVLYAPPDDSENGRGLPLVRACASAWGAGAVGGGKSVWAECGGWRRTSPPRHLVVRPGPCGAPVAPFT